VSANRPRSDAPAEGRSTDQNHSAEMALPAPDRLVVTTADRAMNTPTSFGHLQRRPGPQSSSTRSPAHSQVAAGRSVAGRAHRSGTGSLARALEERARVPARWRDVRLMPSRPVRRVREQYRHGSQDHVGVESHDHRGMPCLPCHHLRSALPWSSFRVCLPVTVRCWRASVLAWRNTWPGCQIRGIRVACGTH
jgi:hypothetical protein